MQFHLNGFKTGDPHIAEVSALVKASPHAATLPPMIVWAAGRCGHRQGAQGQPDEQPAGGCLRQSTARPTFPRHVSPDRSTCPACRPGPAARPDQPAPAPRCRPNRYRLRSLHAPMHAPEMVAAPTWQGRQVNRWGSIIGRARRWNLCTICGLLTDRRCRVVWRASVVGGRLAQI